MKAMDSRDGTEGNITDRCMCAAMAACGVGGFALLVWFLVSMPALR